MTEENRQLFARYEPRVEDKSLSPETKGDLLVRRAAVDDAGAIARLSFQRNGGDLTKLEERLREQLDDPAWAERNLLVVAQRGEKITGFGRAGYFEPPVDAPANVVPAGWYLGGVIVDRAYRRQGMADALTRHRLAEIATRADHAFYFVNAQNQASIDLHHRLGFVEISRDFWYPGVSFTGGGGILYRLDFKEHPNS